MDPQCGRTPLGLRARIITKLRRLVLISRLESADVVTEVTELNSITIDCSCIGPSMNDSSQWKYIASSTSAAPPQPPSATPLIGTIGARSSASTNSDPVLAPQQRLAWRSIHFAWRLAIALNKSHPRPSIRRLHCSSSCPRSYAELFFLFFPPPPSPFRR